MGKLTEREIDRSISVGDLAANYKRMEKKVNIHNAFENERVEAVRRTGRKLARMPHGKRVL